MCVPITSRSGILDMWFSETPFPVAGIEEAVDKYDATYKCGESMMLTETAPHEVAVPSRNNTSFGCTSKGCRIQLFAGGVQACARMYRDTTHAFHASSATKGLTSDGGTCSDTFSQALIIVFSHASQRERRGVNSLAV